MFTIISTALGFFTSFLPKVMAYFQDKQDKAHELAMMDKQLEVQKLTQAGKLDMVKVDAAIREVEAMHNEFAQITGKASQWCVNLASSVRPVLTYLMYIELMTLTVALFFKWITEEQFHLVWSQDMMSLFAAVVAFWFGRRSFGDKIGK